MTQQAFYKALRQWARFDGSALATTWLHRILVNCVRDWARRRAVRAHLPIDEWALGLSDNPTTDAAHRADQRERLATLREAIRRLPDPLRCAFTATVLDGYTYQQAAELLSVPLGTVASRVYGARSQLATTMQELFPEGGP